MKYVKIALILSFLFFISLESGYTHFGMVIPSDNMVMQDESRTIDIHLSFSHPFEMIGMILEKPHQVILARDGKTTEIKDQLIPEDVMGFPAWKLNYGLKRPGAHIFAMVPKPYWEPSEDSFIIHYTKTVVAAFGDESGWDHEIGMKAEIVPLSRPFGLYSGNIFQGTVKKDGKPIPYVTVEVEYYNQDKKVISPNDYMITQTVKADQNGVFSYAVPKPGWWGFAALTESEDTIKMKGQDKAVELGAVIWVQFEGWQEK